MNKKIEVAMENVKKMYKNDELQKPVILTFNFYRKIVDTNESSEIALRSNIVSPSTDEDYRNVYSLLFFTLYRYSDRASEEIRNAKGFDKLLDNLLKL